MEDDILLRTDNYISSFSGFSFEFGETLEEGKFAQVLMYLHSILDFLLNNLTLNFDRENPLRPMFWLLAHTWHVPWPVTWPLVLNNANAKLINPLHLSHCILRGKTLEG